MTISTILKLTVLTIFSGGLFYTFEYEKNVTKPKILKDKIVSHKINKQRSANFIEFKDRFIEELHEIEPLPEIIAEEELFIPVIDEVMVISTPIKKHPRCGCQPYYGHLIQLDSMPELIEEPLENLFSEQEIIDPYIFETNVYPNPTLNEATVDIDIENEDTFIIELYNMNGQLIQQLHNGILDAGRKSFKIELYDYPTGLYIIQIASPTQIETLKLQKV